MIQVKVLDETSPLEAVILGLPNNFGGVPKVEDAYDPKSKFHIVNGSFPSEASISAEMAAFREVLVRHGVEVLRPDDIDGLNQVFSRDIGMVIGDQFVVPKILDHRRYEKDGIERIINQIPPDHILRVHGEARIEGGDIMPWHGKIFAGYSKEEDFQKYIVSRTNEAGIDFLISNFPDWEVHAFELNKSDDDPFQNALHLDCCFQPIGKDKAIIFPDGFKHAEDADYLIDFFGKENVIIITREEMYEMCSNIFSISPEVVVSEKGFGRVNGELRKMGFTVEEVPYAEVGKMEGLLRCSTLPLRRRYV